MVDQTQTKKFPLWWLIWGVVGIIFVVGLIGIIGKNKLGPETNTSSNATAEKVFDVPLLVGKNINELLEILGKPSYDQEPTALQIENGITTWDKTWSKDGYSLSATYDIRDGEVVELFLGADSDRALEVFRNTESILGAGSLSTNSTSYSVEFVKLKAVLGKPKSETPEGYTGVLVKPKQ